MPTPHKNAAEVLVDSITLAGKTVIDVGCGDGSLARQMAKHGAHVTGIDPNAKQIAAARATPAEGTSFVEGVAEKLPMPDGSVDVIVFSNSLHHVPMESLQAAIVEAARVLKKGGILYVSEPLAEGQRFELSKQIDNETEVRAKAFDTLSMAAKWGLSEEREIRHFWANTMRDFDSFRDHQLKVDPKRAAVIAKHEAELKDAFHRLGTKTPEGWEFLQPMRVNILRKN